MSGERHTRQMSKQQKKQDEANAAMAEEVTHLLETELDVPAWAKLLLRETMSIKSDIARRFEQLDGKFESVQRSIQSLTKENKSTVNRVSNAEGRIGALEDANGTVSPRVAKLERDIDSLHNQVDDLISRSKRNNIRLINIKEGTEAGGMETFLSKILSHILDLKDNETPPEVDRAHRAPRPRPDPEQPPRAIFVRLLRWPDRQRILQAAGKKSTLSWEDRRFFVRQDLSPRVQQQRASYNDIIGKIRGKGYRFGILYPARLIITVDGQRLIYDSAIEAEEDLKARLPNIF